MITTLRNGNFRGRLNYFISTVAQGLIEANGVSYSFLNDFIGVLECVKLELYRRVATPYEEDKRQENGDVYVNKKVVSELEIKMSNLQEFDRKITQRIDNDNAPVLESLDL